MSGFPPNTFNLTVDGTLNIPGTLSMPASGILSLSGSTTYNNNILVSNTKAVAANTSSQGIVSNLCGLLTVPATSNNTISTEVDLLAGGTAVPALNTLSSHVGHPLAASTLVAGKILRLKQTGLYTTNGATATITPAVYFNTAAAAVKVGTGFASGTFASGAGPFPFTLDVMIIMIDATHMSAVGTLLMAGMNPATTVSGVAGVSGGAAGAVIVPTSAGNIATTWTGSSNNAGNSFQCLTSTLEFLN